MTGARRAEEVAFEELLAGAGVGAAALDAAEREALDERGYVVLPDVLSARELDGLRAALAAVEAERAPLADEAWTTAAFALAWTHPRLLAAAWHALGRPFRVLVVGGRAPRPGQGRQGLHADWPPRAPDQPLETVTALWMLDAFTPENGATRVVPKSHRIGQPPPRSFGQPGRRHPDEVQVEGRAGSVLVLDGHVWHSGMANRSAAPRRAIQVQLVATRAAPPVTPRPAPAGLDALALVVLGLRPALERA